MFALWSGWGCGTRGSWLLPDSVAVILIAVRTRPKQTHDVQARKQNMAVYGFGDFSPTSGDTPDL